MPSFLISPAEQPPIIRALGISSGLVERHGADILWAEPAVGGLVGVQRKEYTDLLSSVTDGRLGKEVAQLQSMVKVSFLVVEGNPHWTTDGVLNHKWLGKWTRDQYRSLLRDVQVRGVIVEHTDSPADTAVWVESVANWLAKGEHTSLDRRPKQSPDRWGQKTNRSFQRHVLQGIDSIGPKQADLLIDAFGGVPLEWSVSEEQLLAVKGIGPKTVAAMTRAVPCKSANV